MTLAAETIFWTALGCAVYAYVGYPLLLMVLRFIHGAGGGGTDGRGFEPTVSILIPVFNEETVIGRKLANVVALDYPRKKLEIIVASDGSTDGTASLVESYSQQDVRFASLPHRQGKAAALNLGLRSATHEIVVFTDASIVLATDAIRQIVKPFADPLVGCVSGADRIAGKGGEGLYGRLELHLRKLESDVGSIVGASGSFYAQRRELCEPFPEGMAPDFLSVLRVVERGYRAVSTPEAVGIMASASGARDEFRRKVRTLIRGMTTLFAKKRLLNPLRYGTFAFALFSHKIMRWMVPVMAILVFLANLLLLERPVYQAAMVFQAVLCGLAICGAVPGCPGRGSFLCRVPLFFMLANAAILVAWARYLAGERQELWTPTRRT
ncbi:MAG TPA: glycosyltransferase family 2 protein [Candidatus Methanoperedens sp.]|nr:glycosyltransferase family 2 protein [Candidatus Methanoperedens sp.]